jgi:hypothetical protein
MTAIPGPNGARPPLSPASTIHRLVAGLLLSAVTVLLAVVVLTPVALSSHDLIAWAAAPTGLALPPPWPMLVFLALDAAAAVCVLLAVYSAWRGEPAGVFGVLVWCFAVGSAFANWRHNSTPHAAPDAVWFFPAMSLAGPALLEAVLGRLRRWVQRDTGRRARTTPAFGWRRWTPGLGAPRDTYGAYRTALLLGIDTLDAAITAYHSLCPDGSIKVAAALRAQHTRRAQTTDSRPTTGNGNVTLPVAIMRRIPVDLDAYQRWRLVWADLQQNRGDLNGVAEHHHLSRRQVEFIRRAGQAGLLNSPLPPAVRLAAMVTTTEKAAAPQPAAARTDPP